MSISHCWNINPEYYFWKVDFEILFYRVLNDSIERLYSIGIPKSVIFKVFNKELMLISQCKNINPEYYFWNLMFEILFYRVLNDSIER